jgi:hypothetical protein
VSNSLAVSLERVALLPLMPKPDETRWLAERMRALDALANPTRVTDLDMAEAA